MFRQEGSFEPSDVVESGNNTNRGNKAGCRLVKIQAPGAATTSSCQQPDLLQPPPPPAVNGDCNNGSTAYQQQQLVMAPQPYSFIPMDQQLYMAAGGQQMCMTAGGLEQQQLCMTAVPEQQLYMAAGGSDQQQQSMTAVTDQQHQGVSSTVYSAQGEFFSPPPGYPQSSLYYGTPYMMPYFTGMQYVVLQPAGLQQPPVPYTDTKLAANKNDDENEEVVGGCQTCKDDTPQQEDNKDQHQHSGDYQTITFIPTPTARNMHLSGLSNNSSCTSSPSATPSYQQESSSATSTSDYMAGSGYGGPLLQPPPAYYQPEYTAQHHFVFPVAAMPPLTPITPSVEPALGLKNGYAVPHTPNPMTVSQFVQGVKSSPAYYPAPVPIYEGEEPAAAPSTSSLQLRNPPFGRGGYDKSKTSNDSAGDAQHQRRRLDGGSRPQYIYEPEGCFVSPFKRFVPFSGVPHLNQFPMRSPLYESHAYSRGQGGRSVSSNQRYPSPRTGSENPNGGHRTRPQRLSSGGDSKPWYKAGARFGQRSSSSGQPPLSTDTAVITPPATPARDLAPLLLSSAEPDLLQGQMKKLAL